MSLLGFAVIISVQLIHRADTKNSYVGPRLGDGLCIDLCSSIGLCHSSFFMCRNPICLSGNTSARVVTQKEKNQKLMSKDGYVELVAGKDRLFVKLHNNAMSWMDALSVCKAEGGSLVKIDTKFKQQALHKRYYKQTDAMRRLPAIWIGLRDALKDDTFVWTDGNKLKFKDWFVHQPTNKAEEDCVTVASHVLFGFHWSTEKCSYKMRFICELH